MRTSCFLVTVLAALAACGGETTSNPVAPPAASPAPAGAMTLTYFTMPG